MTVPLPTQFIFDGGAFILAVLVGFLMVTGVIVRLVRSRKAGRRILVAGLVLGVGGTLVSWSALCLPFGLRGGDYTGEVPGMCRPFLGLLAGSTSPEK